MATTRSLVARDEFLEERGDFRRRSFRGSHPADKCDCQGRRRSLASVTWVLLSGAERVRRVPHVLREAEILPDHREDATPAAGHCGCLGLATKAVFFASARASNIDALHGMTARSAQRSNARSVSV